MQSASCVAEGKPIEHETDQTFLLRGEDTGPFLRMHAMIHSPEPAKIVAETVDDLTWCLGAYRQTRACDGCEERARSVLV